LRHVAPLKVDQWVLRLTELECSRQSVIERKLAVGRSRRFQNAWPVDDAENQCEQAPGSHRGR